MLEVDEASRLGKELLAGGAATERRKHRTTIGRGVLRNRVERLAGLGLNRYEISNFARPAGIASQLKYWKLEPYAGFGADAHSFDGRMRTRNAETVDEYLNGGAGPDLPRSIQILIHRFRVPRPHPPSNEWASAPKPAYGSSFQYFKL